MTDLARHAAERYGPSVVVAGTADRITFDDFDGRVELLSRSLPAGVRTTLTMRPRVDDLAAFCAHLRRGNTVVLLSDRLPHAARARLVATYGLDGTADPHGPRIGIMTSGSTGAPRIVVHTPASLAGSASGAARHLGFGPGSAWLLALPLYHVGGLGVFIRALVAGGCLLPGSSDPAPGLAHATHVSLVATQLHRLLEAGAAPPATLEAVLLGGSALPEELIARAHASGWPVVASYGMTEMGSLVTATRPGDLPSSSGRVLDGRRLMIDPDGEIMVRGDAACAGYLLPDGTVYGAHRDGWIPTGDRGTIDEDGRLTVIGRLDNQFISGGENIQPEAIERVLSAVPGVRMAVVVPVEDAEFGARPYAFVDGVRDEAALRAALTSALPRFMMPVAFDAMPPSAQSGIKPSRRVLREIAGLKYTG